MRATEPGAPGRRWPAGRLAQPARPRDEHGQMLVRLVTRLVVAQTIAAAAIGLPFSRRHLASVLITLAVVAALCVLVLVVRSGTRAAWLIAVGFEVAFVSYGLSRFFAARYLGGTLFAILALGTLAYPAVARAFAVMPRRAPQAPPGDLGLSEAAGDACGGQVRG